MGSVKNFHHPGDLDPYPANNALNSYTLIREEPYKPSGRRHRVRAGR